MHFVFLTKFPLSSLFSMLIVRSSSLTPLHAFFYSSSTKQFDCQDSGSILSILHFLLVAPSVLWLRLPVPDTMVAQPSLFSQSAALQSLFPMKSTFCTGLLQRHFLFRYFLFQPSPPIQLLTTTWVGAMVMASWDHKLNNVAFPASSCMLPYLFCNNHLSFLNHRIPPFFLL